MNPIVFALRHPITMIMLVVALVGFVVGRGVSGPILGMTAAMTKLAGGDKTIAIPGVGRTDEICNMAAAVQVFKDSMIRADELAADQLDSLVLVHDAERDQLPILLPRPGACPAGSASAP